MNHQVEHSEILYSAHTVYLVVFFFMDFRTNRVYPSIAAFLKPFSSGDHFLSQNVLRTTLLLGLSNSLGLP